MSDTQDAVDDAANKLVTELTERLIAERPPKETSEREFLEHQYDLGLAWVHFDKGWGGLGISPKAQKTVIEKIVAAGGPVGGTKNPIGYGMCAPAVVQHGTDEHKAMLRPLFSNEHIWCQLFSEPGAGSDVASLACKADQDGDQWVLNGQKVWTTLAHISRYGLIIARHDPSAQKHKGLTAFIVDMEAPGVEVRPLRQITGEAEFNEVYFTDVVVSDAMRLDAVGQGWGVAITTLMNERVSIGGATPPKNSGPIGQLLDLWKKSDFKTPALQDEFMKLWAKAEIGRLTNIRASQNRKAGTPGPEGSVSKLAMAELNKEIYALGLHLMGPDGMMFGSYEMHQPKMALFSDDMSKNFLRAMANSIEGGTSEVMRNILGERVLGLPGDIRSDKDRPWSEVPRS